MAEELPVWKYLLTLAIALESHVHQNIVQYLVLSVKDIHLVADSALKLSGGKTLISYFGERIQTLLAAKLMATFTF